MVDFVNDVEKQLNKIIKEVEEEAAQVFRKVVKDAYDHLISPGVSPVWSGYYKSNHRITIRSAKGQFKTGGVKLFPTEKPEFPEVLIYIDNVQRTAAIELRKLDKLEIGDTAQISTSVPYADEVELIHQVYANTEAIFRAST